MRNQRRGRKCLLVILLCVTAILLSACKREEGDGKVIFTTGVGKDVVFRIGDEDCRKEELMLYLVTAQNRYEEVFGEEIWDTKTDGVTLEENVKETALAQIAQVKTMYLMAVAREMKLTEQEAAQIQKASEAFYTSLSEHEVSTLGVTPEMITELYTEYALAEKIYESIIKDVNPEISDDEARIITVQQILIRTYTEDEQGNRIPYSDIEKQAAYAKALSVLTEVLNNSSQFEDLALKYSEDEVITSSFGKGETDPVIEDAVFALATEGISDVIETEQGYHIFKCTSTLNREQTDANKVKILEKRRAEAFGQEYDLYAESVNKQLNETLWAEIALLRDSQVTTSSFFEVYETFCGSEQ